MKTVCASRKGSGKTCFCAGLSDPLLLALIATSDPYNTVGSESPCRAELPTYMRGWTGGRGYGDKGGGIGGGGAESGVEGAESGVEGAGRGGGIWGWESGKIGAGN